MSELEPEGLPPGVTPSDIGWMREWVGNGGWKEFDTWEEIKALPAELIVDGVNVHYPGGVERFVSALDEDGLRNIDPCSDRRS